MAPNTQIQEVILSNIRLLITSIQVWLPYRRNSIEIMREEAAKLEKITKNTNIAKLVGTSLGIAGGLLTLAGGLAATATAARLMIGLGMMVAVGSGVLNFGTEINRFFVSKKKGENVHEVLEGDRSEKKKTKKQINRFSNFMSNIPNQDLEKYERFVDVKRLRELIDDANYNAQTSCITVPKGERVDRLSISQLLRVFSLLSFLPSLFQRGGQVSQVSVKSMANSVATCIKDLLRRLTISLKLWGFHASIKPLSELESKAEITTRGVAGVVTPMFLAIDIYQLVHTVIDVNNGSKSEVATSLREIADKLERELRENERLLHRLEDTHCHITSSTPVNNTQHERSEANAEV